MFGFYDGPTNGKIDKQTKDAILAFQISENIIPNKNAQGAGNVGPKTSAVLKIKSEEFNSRVIKNQNRLKRNIEALTSNIGKKDSGNKVYRLQQMLWELGYYRGELNGKYDKITIDAVYQFQKNHDVVKSEYDRGAGYFGKKTHTALIAAIGEQMKKLKEFPKKIQTWVPAKIELPKLVNLKSYTKKTERKSLLFNIDLIKESDLLTKDIDYKDRSGDVKKMQDVLIAMGYLGEGLNTGFFGNQTRVALIEFQIAKGIVKKPTDQGAGRVGPTTREVLNKI